MIDFCRESSPHLGQAKVVGLVDSGQARQAQLTQAFNHIKLCHIEPHPPLKDGLVSFARACPAVGPKGRRHL